MKTITLWHGGRDLENNYLNFKTPQKDKWEHGPGIYLTTHYLTTKKYAKGGGKTYLVTLDLGNNIEDIFISIDKITDFINKYTIKSTRDALIHDINQNILRLNLNNKICANSFLNLILFHNSIRGQNIEKLNNFLVENKVDYIQSSYTGNEKIIVVLNRNKIQKIEVIAAKNVKLDMYELPIDSSKNQAFFCKRNLETKFKNFPYTEKLKNKI